MLFLLVLLIGGGAPLLRALAGDLAGPGNNGTAATANGEVAETIARAVALYGEFRSREALTELKKALALVPGHPEALIWAARAHVDVGDLIPETVPDWQKKRVEQYRAAERYAREAASIQPPIDLAPFLSGGGLGKAGRVLRHQEADSAGAGNPPRRRQGPRFSDDGIHKRNARKLLEDIARNGDGCHESC